MAGFQGTPLIKFESRLYLAGGDSVLLGMHLTHGVTLSSDGNAVEGNIVEGGIYVDGGNGNTIGGTTPAARNVIGGGAHRGVYVSDADGTTIQGNFIGVDATGTVAWPNDYGIKLSHATNTQIGGTEDGAENVISGNLYHGVSVGTASEGNRMQGNLIGTDATEAAALPNGLCGISIYDGTGHVIGGKTAEEANVIAYNKNGGIALYGLGTALTTTASILGNRIFSNVGLGIDLIGDGVTPNDYVPSKSRIGPNNLQDYPVVQSATMTGGVTTIQATLNSTPNTTFRIEFFSNAECDPSGHGEGENFLGFKDVTTDANGDAGFAFEYSGEVQVVTATATDPNGYTSEFSACRAVNLPTTIVVNVTGDEEDADGTDDVCDSDLATADEQCTLRAAIQEANRRSGNDKITFEIPGGGTPTIRPQSALPTVTDPVIIDATTQPGGGRIELDGTSAGTNVDGLQVTAANSTVKALRITDFKGSGLYANIPDGQVVLEGIEVHDNGGSGIKARAQQVVISGSGTQIHDNGGWGIGNDSGSVEIHDGAMQRIHKNGQGGVYGEFGVSVPKGFIVEDNGGPGIAANGSGDLTLENIKIRNNQGDGVGALMSGSVKISGTDSDISNNGGRGIHAWLGDVVGQNLKVTNNGSDGIRAAGDVEIRTGRVCSNGGKDIVAGGQIDLEDVVVDCSGALTGVQLLDSQIYVSFPAGTNQVIGPADNPAPDDVPSEIAFPFGLFELVVGGLAPGGATAATLLLPPDVRVDTYYKYGPTPDNPNPHWYEFSYDGTTGAEILDDRIILHFVDGQRGDSDLTVNGTIPDPGGPVVVTNGTLSGYVYADVNNNGIKEPHEVGLPNVPITIDGPVTSTVVTNSDGRYEFADLPVGQYAVTQAQPSAFNDGIESLGPTGLGRVEGEGFADLDLPAGTEATDYNFGERGLRAEFVSRWQLMNRPLADQFVLDLIDGIGFSAFQANRNGAFAASAEGEGLAAIELCTSDMMPVAIAAAGQPLSATVVEGESYVLLVTGSDGPVDLQTAIQTLTPVYLTNALNPLDVDGSGMTTPLDVLVLISALNAGSIVDGSQVYYVDVNSDKQLTTLDVLTVIKHLTANATQSAATGGEGEPSSQFELPFEPDAAPPSRAREGGAEGLGRDQVETLSEPLARLSQGESEDKRERAGERVLHEDNLFLPIHSEK